MLADEDLLARDRSGEVEEAIASVERLAATSGDRRLEAFALARRGLALHSVFLRDRSAGEPAGELELFERALALRREISDASGVAESLFHVGLVHQVIRDENAASRPFFEESYERAKALGDDVLASYALRHVAFCDQADGDLSAAQAKHEEALELRRRAGWVPGVGAQLFALAELEAERGRREQARELAVQAREVFASVGAERLVKILEAELAELLE